MWAFDPRLDDSNGWRFWPVQHSIRFVVLVIGVSSTAACSRVHYDPAQLLQELPNDSNLLLTAFAPASQILSGFDDPETGTDWRIGDQILFGLAIDRGGQRTVRFILVELKSGLLPPDADVVIIRPDAQPPADDPSHKTVVVRLADGDSDELIGRLPARRWSMKMTFTDEKTGTQQHVTRNAEPVLVAVHVYDDAGRKLRSAGTLAPEAYLRSGFYAACAAAEQLSSRDAFDRAAAVDAFADFMPSLYALGQSIGETPNLKHIIETVVPRPSLWSLLVHRGIHASVDFPPKLGRFDVATEDRPLVALRDGLHAYRFPFDIEINGEPGIRCILSVVDPRPPFHLCAGVVGLNGTQVKDPTRRITMRLLAARRGPPTF
jgi:hypothetical protein